MSGLELRWGWGCSLGLYWNLGKLIAMQFLIFWAGMAISSFGLIALISGENGGTAVVIGIILMLLSVIWILSITTRTARDRSANVDLQHAETKSPPEELKEEEEEEEDFFPPQTNAAKEIHTRTIPGTPGIRYVDRYAGRERPFTEEEDTELLNLYAHGLNLVSIANTMSIDQRQIAIRLIRLLLDPSDVIEDEESAENNRRKYRKGEKDEIEAEYRMGHSIDVIAQSHGRTVLAIGWQLLERPNRPVAQ